MGTALNQMGCLKGWAVRGGQVLREQAEVVDPPDKISAWVKAGRSFLRRTSLELYVKITLVGFVNESSI